MAVGFEHAFWARILDDMNGDGPWHYRINNLRTKNVEMC